FAYNHAAWGNPLLANGTILQNSFWQVARRQSEHNHSTKLTLAMPPPPKRTTTPFKAPMGHILNPEIKKGAFRLPQFSPNHT
ncbi:hypothetical protein, partial [Atlantibacter sp.]|uniref:hypothetical protein n=1 Tax=Atlantibacter sp. TaxID=1903473 RepID=UPI00289A88E6